MIAVQMLCKMPETFIFRMKKFQIVVFFIPSYFWAGLLEFQATKTALLPRIKKLCINTGLLSVRVNCLVCIGKLLQHLDKWLVLDDILPMLQQIPSREPAVVMAIIGNYSWLGLGARTRPPKWHFMEGKGKLQQKCSIQAFTS